MIDELSFLDDMSDFCDKSDEGNDGEFMWDAEMSFVVCAFVAARVRSTARLERQTIADARLTLG